MVAAQGRAKVELQGHTRAREVRPDLLQHLLDVFICECQALRESAAAVAGAEWTRHKYVLASGGRLSCSWLRPGRIDEEFDGDRQITRRTVSVSIICSTSMISGMRSFRRRSMPIFIVVVLQRTRAAHLQAAPPSVKSAQYVM